MGRWEVNDLVDGILLLRQGPVEVHKSPHTEKLGKDKVLRVVSWLLKITSSVL